MGVISGTKLPDGTVVIRGDAQHLNKIRCMSCQCLAYESARADGKKLFRCTNCGREWTSTRI